MTQSILEKSIFEIQNNLIDFFFIFSLNFKKFSLKPRGKT